MVLKVIRCHLFLILSMCAFVAKGQTTWSLEQCVAIALKNNPGLHRNELLYESAKIDRRQSALNALPSVSGDFGHGFSQGRSIDPTTNQFIDQTISAGNSSITAGAYLFNGFKVLHDIRMKAAGERAEKLGYDAQKEALILDVMEAYITTLTAKDLLQQAEDQLVLSKEQLNRSEILHKEGDIDPGDYYDLSGAYSESKNQVAAAKQNLFHSRVVLAGLMHISEEELPELEVVSFTPKQPALSAAELFDTGKQRPFYALWDWRIREAAQNIKVAKADFFPSLSVSAGMMTRYSNSGELSFWKQNNNNLEKFISLNLHIPIFNGFSVRNAVKKARLGLEDVLWQKEISENTLREATAKAVFDLKIAEESVQNLTKQEKQYEESFRIAKVKFDLGASNSVLYLTAKNKWENSKAQLLIRHYEWVLQNYINEYYRGELRFE